MSIVCASPWIEHPLVPGVRAISTLRGIAPDDYAWGRGGAARAALVEALGGNVRPVWMHQVHGVECVDLDALESAEPPTADAAVTRTPGRAAVVLTADCLPIFIASRNGSVVAVVHAGWRGLAAGVIDRTVQRMSVDPSVLVARFGPAIGSAAFEVGPEVRDVFVRRAAAAASAFRPGRADRWHADIYELARQSLAHLGVAAPASPAWCTREADYFHSWRRSHAAAGRMAHLIWRLPRKADDGNGQSRCG